MPLAEKTVQQMKTPVPGNTQCTIPKHLQHNDTSDVTRTQRRHEDPKEARNNATEKNPIKKRRNPSARHKPTRERHQCLRNRRRAIIRRNECCGHRPKNDSRHQIGSRRGNADPPPKWGSDVLIACTRISNSTLHLPLPPPRTREGYAEASPPTAHNSQPPATPLSIFLLHFPSTPDDGERETREPKSVRSLLLVAKP